MRPAAVPSQTKAMLKQSIAIKNGNCVTLHDCLSLLAPVQSTKQALWIMCHSTINLNAGGVLVDMILPEHCHVNEFCSASSAVPISTILCPE